MRSKDAPSPKPSPASWLAPSALALGFGALWLALPDKTFVFDGVIFSQVVERSIDEWRRELFNPRHLLFNPFFQLLRDALGGTVGAYRLFQVMNAFAGAAGLLLFGDFVRRLTRDAARGWCAALLLGATLCYGTRATEGQVYMLMSLGVLAALWCAARLLEAPTPGRAAALAAAVVLGSLFHAADAFLFPALLVALWRAFPKSRATAAAVFSGACLAVAAANALAFHGAGLRGFLASGAEYHAGSGGFWSGLLVKFAGDGLNPAARLVPVWRETGGAAAPMSAGAGTALGLLLWLAAGAAARAAWPSLDAPRRALAAVTVAAWAGFTVVNAFWPGGDFFYVPALACAVALVFLAPRSAPPAALAAAGLALTAWNVRAGLIPQSLLENNPGYRRAVFIGRHTVPSSRVVISGLGFPNSKVYIPNFARRPREVLEFYLTGRPKADGLRLLRDFTAKEEALGVPLYLLSDLVEDARVAGDMRRLWGVDLADVQNAFGPGRVVRVAASPEERVYLYIPKGQEPELFAALAYSVLTESDMTLVGESADALKSVARDMPPAQARRAAALMKSSGYGFDLLRDAFLGEMSAESKAGMAKRAQAFADYRATPEFFLRLGNVYRYLGLKSETIEAWTRAQKLSGDPGLLKDIEALRRAP